MQPRMPGESAKDFLLRSRATRPATPPDTTPGAPQPLRPFWAVNTPPGATAEPLPGVPDGFVPISAVGYDNTLDFLDARIPAPGGSRDATIIGTCPFTGYIRVMAHDTGRKIYTPAEQTFINPNQEEQ